MIFISPSSLTPSIPHPSCVLSLLPAAPHPQIAPTGMIFIPCRNGWSHRPDELASPADIGRGVEVLALTLARLAGEAGAGAEAKTEL